MEEQRFCVYCFKPRPIGKKKYCCNQCRLDADKGKSKKAKLKKARETAQAIADLNQAAKAEGLSYGQYVAKYHGKFEGI